MAVRTFHPATPTLSKTASLSDKALFGTMPERNGAQRSPEAAKKATEAFPANERDPLHSHRTQAKQGITFAAQENLPTLPIPDLDNSLSKFLEALKPLQSPKERSDSELAVQEFSKRDGPDLQEKLKKYAAGKANYIEQFCKQFMTC